MVGLYVHVIEGRHQVTRPDPQKALHLAVSVRSEVPPESRDKEKHGISYGSFPPTETDSDSDSKPYRYIVFCTTFSTLRFGSLYG